MKKKDKAERLDLNARDAMFEILKDMEKAEGKRLSFREMTRRMVRTENFPSVKEELITDAKIKKRRRQGYV